MKTVFYLLFLVSFAASLGVASSLQAKIRVKRSKFRDLLFAVNGLLFFFFFIWLLSGFWNLTVVIAFVVASLTGLILAQVLWAVVGPDEGINYVDQMEYFFLDSTVRNPVRKSLIVYGFGFIYILFFPIAMGYAYFSGDLWPDERTQLIIKIAVLMNIVNGLAISIPLGFNILASKNTNEDIRSIYAIQSVGGALVNALWIATVLWAFNIGSNAGFNIPTGSVTLKISPHFLALFFSFVFLTLFLPYIMGAQRGKKWRRRLLNIRKKLLEELIERLKKPELKVEELHLYSAHLEKEKKKFLDEDPVFQRWVARDKGPSLAEQPDPDLEIGGGDPNSGQDTSALYLKNMASQNAHQIDVALEEALPKGRDTDFRFQQMDFLDELNNDLQEIISKFGKRKTAKVEQYVETYNYQASEVLEEIKENENRDNKVYTLIFLLVSAVIGQFFSTFGQWAWALFSKS